MYSGHECGVCYQTYNAGRRCPRLLHCAHSFCETCLLALSQPRGSEEAPGRGAADRVIVCPLCRHHTLISGEGKAVRAELRVDESVLEQLQASGVLYQEEEEDPDPEEEEETAAEESDTSAGSGGGALRRSCGKVWRLLSGKSSRRRGRENCMTDDDLRDFALMSCYMF